MTPTVSFLPSAPPAAPRAASPAAASRAPVAADTGTDGGDAPVAEANGGPGGTRPFSAWMREQQTQQQSQDRRRLAGSTGPGHPALAAGGKDRGKAAKADAGAGADGPVSDAEKTRGVALAAPDAPTCDAPLGDLAALLAAARAADAGETAVDADGGAPTESARSDVRLGAQARDRATGRADGPAGDALQRAGSGTDAAATAGLAAATVGTDSARSTDAAARGPGAAGDAVGDRRTAEAGRGTGAHGAGGASRGDGAPRAFDASLDGARQRLGDAGREAAPSPAPTAPAAAALAPFAHGALAAPVDGLRTPAHEAAPPLALDLATPVDAADFAPALGTQVAVLAKDGVQRAELNLHPADMGPVSIDISIVGTTAHVDFGADVAATRSAIESGLADLAAALHEAGFTLAGGGVSARARERDGGQGDDRSDDGTRRVGDGASGRRGAAADEPTGPRVTPRTVRLRDGAVDLYA